MGTPRDTSVALTPNGMELRCEACKTIIESYEFPGNEGKLLWEMIRSSLRHPCQEVTDGRVAGN